MACAIVAHDNRLLLLRQPHTASRWARMWLFPTVEVQSEPEAAEKLETLLKATAALSARVGEKRGSLKHSVTRYRITLHVYAATLRGTPTAPEADGHVAWCLPQELRQHALPAVHRRIANSLVTS
jgi:A/G-specific adenine glycosylase